MNDEQPVAWVVGGPSGPRVFWSREEASQYMRGTLSGDLLCLYKRQAMRLTDEEREAVETACVSIERDDRFYENESALLRATLERLLERLK